MKKIGTILVLFLLSISFISFISAQNDIQEGTEKVGEATGGLLSEEGINIPEQEELKEKFVPWKSKAEQRIEKVDQWLDDNMSWLRWIFGMKPEISWAFAINLFLILFLINFLIFNIREILPLSDTTSLIIGICTLVVIMILKLTVTLAKWTDSILRNWWFKLIVMFVIIFLIVFFTLFGKKLGEWKKKRGEEKQKMKFKQFEGVSKMLEDAFTKRK